MSFVTNEPYSYEDIVRIYKASHPDQKALTRGGFLNPARGKHDTLIRAIFARKRKNGPSPNLLFVSGDNTFRSYRKRIEKIMAEKTPFLYFNETEGEWIYQGESRILDVLDPDTEETASFLQSKGYSLIRTGEVDGVAQWQLQAKGENCFTQTRPVEFIAVIDSEADPVELVEHTESTTGRVVKTMASRRLDQGDFSRDVSKRYRRKCIITHAAKIPGSQFVQACHISSERDAEGNIADNSEDNGILLRSDLHALFDSGLLTINPDSGLVHFANAQLQQLYPQYHNTLCPSWDLVSKGTRRKLANRVLR